MPRHLGLRAAAVATTAWALAGCITIAPMAVPTTKGASPASPAPASAAPAKKAPELAARPKAGDAATLDKLKAAGRVQVSFKGLGGKARRTLKQTTDDIARVEVTIEGANGFVATQALSRDEMMGPMASLFFDRVPIGPATLRVRAYDVAGDAIGGGEEALEVVGGKTTEVGMAVKLGATGGVGATIAFEDADVEETNVTGYWYVGGDGPPPEYPVIGCGDGYVWYVTQFGDSVRASSSGYDAEGPHAGMWWSEEAYGTIRDGVIALHGRTTYTDADGNEAAAAEEAEYELRFDANRWQMVGTRNGRPGWATPYYFEPGCHGGATPPPFVSGTPAPYPGAWYPRPVASAAWSGKRVAVEGVLYDSNGDPAGGVEVWLDSYDDAVPYGDAVTTDAEGRYRFENVPTGVELEFYADTEDETADAWQVFYGFEDLEHHDLWMSADEDWEDEGEEEEDEEADGDEQDEGDWEDEDEDQDASPMPTARPTATPTPAPTPTPTPNGN